MIALPVDLQKKIFIQRCYSRKKT